jgi:hypothetical protein
MGQAVLARVLLKTGGRYSASVFVLRNRHQDGFDSKSHTKRFGIWLTQRLASQNSRRKSPPDGSPSLYITDIDLPNNTMKEEHFQSQGL